MSQTTRRSARIVLVAAESLRGSRWDPGFWQRADAGPDDACGLPCASLGDFIYHLTYGPILTGQRPQPVPDGVAIVSQGVIQPTGVLLEQATCVAEGSPYDPPRCRLQPGDIVLARSGAGTLAKKRFTVFREPAKAAVSCFVDLLRLRGISPYYVVTFLRSRPGWSQIQRLINGVGTPNLSFGEIRSLRIPRLPDEEQRQIDIAWQEVERLHAQRRLAEAQAALDPIVADIENRLALSPQGTVP